MDNSRVHDLRELHKRMNDPSISEFARFRAHRNFQRIQSKLNDRKLTGLRSRLIKAHQADDAATSEKLEALIREHAWRTYREVAQG